MPDTSSDILTAAKTVLRSKLLLAPPDIDRLCESMTEEQLSEVLKLSRLPNAHQHLERFLQTVSDLRRPIVAEAATDAPTAEERPRKRPKAA